MYYCWGFCMVYPMDAIIHDSDLDDRDPLSLSISYKRDVGLAYDDDDDDESQAQSYPAIDSEADRKTACVFKNEPYVYCWGRGIVPTCKQCVHKDHCLVCRMTFVARSDIYGNADHIHICSLSCFRRHLIFLVAPDYVIPATADLTVSYDMRMLSDHDLLTAIAGTSIGFNVNMMSIAVAEIERALAVEYETGKAPPCAALIPPIYTPPTRDTIHLYATEIGVQLDETQASDEPLMNAMPFSLPEFCTPQYPTRDPDPDPISDPWDYGATVLLPASMTCVQRLDKME